MAKLYIKIIAWSFIPTALVLLLVAITTYIAYQQVTQEQVISRDEELTRLSASELSAAFEDYVDRLTALARLPKVYSGNPGEQQAAFADSKNRLVIFDAGVYLINNLGRVVAAPAEKTSVVGQDWSDQAFFENMIRSPSVEFSDVVQLSPDNEDVIAIAAPILGEEDEFRGVALGAFRLDASAVSPFYGTILKLHIGRSGHAFLVDGNGRVIYASDFNQIGKDFTGHPVSLLAQRDEVGAVRTRSQDGRDIVAGYAPVPRTKWRLVVEEDWRELTRSAQGYRQYLTLIMALGVIIPTIVVTIGVRRITGPIRDFIAAAQRIAGGDFSQPIQIRTRDELEELAQQFNTMAEALQDSYETLEMRVAQRTQELSALYSVAEVTSKSLDLDQILPDALAKTIEVMGMEGGAIFRLDEVTGTLEAAAHQGLGDRMVAMSQHLDLESSIIHEVVHKRQATARLVCDYPPGEVRDALASEGWTTVVSIPLIAQTKILGAINVASRSEASPSEEALAVAAAIGQQIGVAIDNARLYAQTVRYARDREAARLAAEQARAAAEAANSAKSDFLANVSHELRTPLASILGFARLVRKRLEERVLPALPSEDTRAQKMTDQVEENLEIIIEEGQRLMLLINNLLDLEKIEAGMMEWRIQPTSMAEVIQKATSATASLFEGKALSLILDVPPDLPLVNGDPDKLLQVVINMISNAVKFSSSGSVTVRACRGDNELVVEVADQGIGISLMDQAFLFEKFTQVGDPIKGKPKGTGLGLAISREIIERHGGRIWVNSQPGQGSTFSFALPLDAGEETSEPSFVQNQPIQDI